MRATRRVETTPKRAVARPQAAQTLPLLQYAKVVQAISAASGNTLGKGTISLRGVAFDGTNATTSDAGTGTFPCFSQASSSIAAGRTIIVGPIGSVFQVISDFC